MKNRADRSLDVALLAAVGVAACCGLPVLLAAGAGVTIAGLALRSWFLIGAGALAAAAGFVLWRSRTRKKVDDRE